MDETAITNFLRQAWILTYLVIPMQGSGCAFPVI